MYVSISRGLVGTIAILFAMSPVQAQASTPSQYQTYSNSQLAKAFGQPIHWNAKALAAASKAIKKQISLIKADEAKLQKLGVVKFKVKWATQTMSSLGATKLAGQPSVRSFQLLGYDYSDNFIKATGTYPRYASDLPGYLIKPSYSECRTDGFQLFDPATWFAKSCDITAPKAQDYLLASLKAHVAYAPTGDLLIPVAQQVAAIPVDAVLAVSGAKLTCSANCGDAAMWPMAAAVERPLGGYTLTLSGASKVTITESLPQLQKLANLARLGVDGAYVTFG